MVLVKGAAFHCPMLPDCLPLLILYFSISRCLYPVHYPLEVYKRRTVFHTHSAELSRVEWRGEERSGVEWSVKWGENSEFLCSIKWNNLLSIVCDRNDGESLHMCRWLHGVHCTFIMQPTGHNFHHDFTVLFAVLFFLFCFFFLNVIFGYFRIDSFLCCSERGII